MSGKHGIVPYVVRLEPLRAFWGSRDLQALERIQSLYRSNIADNAQLYRYLLDQGAPSLDVALSEMANGEIRQPKFASQYAYALELLCAHFGHKQPNKFTNPADLDTVSRALDPVFKALGMGTVFSVAQLVGSGWPLPLPEDGGLPRGGTVEFAEVEHIVQALRSGRLPGGLTLETVQLLGELRTWFEAAMTHQSGVVCFYY